MTSAVIIDSVRTPIGRAFKGSLSTVRADTLASIPLKALAERNPEFDPAETSDVIMGCGFPEREQGYGIGRAAVLLAGYGHAVPATTVSRFCASSLQAVAMAAQAIKSGDGHQYVAAGVEAISRTGPWSDVPPNPNLNGSPEAAYDYYVHMGTTAENVALEAKISREAQDEWAFLSQTRAVRSQDNGHFEREIVAVPVPESLDEDGLVLVESHRVIRDDGPRAGTTLEKLGQLRPVFSDEGSVTAGNACPMSDGAAAVLVTSEAHARARGLKPRARVISSHVAGVRPELMGLGPIPAVEGLLTKVGMAMTDIDTIEINEAFAAQVVACQRALGIESDRLNPSGGAIALGHPYGMSGARLVGAVLNNLEQLDGTFGIATMCTATGMGQAILIERM